MRIYTPGDTVKFRSEHGNILDGTVYDSNDSAVMISTHFGTYSVSPDKIVSGGTWKITVNNTVPYPTKDDSYDLGWWDDGSD